jgi:hypothetical protein
MKAILTLASGMLFVVVPITAVAGSCPQTLDDWKSWRDQAISQLLQPRLTDINGAHVNYYQVMATSVQIANFIDDCYPRFGQPTSLDSQIGNLRKFVSNLRNNLSVPTYDHQFGYSIDDYAYLQLVQENVDLPDLLKNQQFLRKISNRKSYRDALRMIERHNKHLPSEKQWIVLIYKSRFLTTPDEAQTYGRFFVFVPGDKYDKWIQFGIRLPEDRNECYVNNLSIVSISKPDIEGRRFNALIDWWRTYKADGTISLQPRRISQGVTENCLRCHKTSPLGIHPAEEYAFDKKGMLVPNETAVGAAAQKLNAVIMGYGAPYFGKLADTTAYGPPLGEDIQRSDEFMKYCTQGLSLSDASIKKVKENMSCTDCHSESGAGAVGLLNFPEATNNRTAPDNQIYSYLTEAWMPPSLQLLTADRARLNQSTRSERTKLYPDLSAHLANVPTGMSPNERKGLFSCLIKEYFDVDKQTGTLVEWLKGNRGGFGLLNARPDDYMWPVPTTMRSPHD